MNTDTFLAAIHRELQRRFRAAGAGSIGRVEKALDLSAGYFRDQRRPDRLRVDLRILLRTLEVLEVDRAEFFGTILGSCDPMVRFRNEGLLLQLKQRRPIPILTAMQRRRDQPPQTPILADLAALDAERDHHPARLERQTKSLMSQVGEWQIVPLLGIYASACRVQGKLSRAHVVLATALGAAHGTPATVLGDLLLRSVSVLGDQGRFAHARELAEKALTQYALADDRLGLAKAMIKMGMAQGCAGQQEAEMQSFEAALHYLESLPNQGKATTDATEAHASIAGGDEATDDEIHRHLFAALTNLALAHHQRENYPKADDLARRAEAVAEPLGPALAGKLVWLRGSIAWRAGDLATAETHLRRAMELHHRRAPLSNALIGVDLVDVQLQQGHAADALQTTRAMASLVGSLERYPVALAAITQLIRHALEGHELVSAVQEAARGLKRCGELHPAEQTGWNRLAH